MLPLNQTNQSLFALRANLSWMHSECIYLSNSFNPPHFTTFLSLIKEDDLIRVSAESNPVVSTSPFDTLAGGRWLALIIVPIRLLRRLWAAAEVAAKPTATCFETCQEVAVCQHTWQQWVWSWWMRILITADGTIITQQWSPQVFCCKATAHSNHMALAVNVIRHKWMTSKERTWTTLI